MAAAGDSDKGPERTPAKFPSTHWSVLRAAGPAEGGGDAEGRRLRIEALAQIYWKPVYAHFRLRWRQPREEATDLTQDFFVWVLENPSLSRAEPGHGRFRGFVRTHIDHFMQNHLRTRDRLRRGGGRPIFSLDAAPDALEALPDPAGQPPEAVLDLQWRKAILDEAMKRLQLALVWEGRPQVFQTLRRYCAAEEGGRPPTYAALAQELNVPATDIGNYLREAKRELAKHLEEVVAESVDGPEALRAEMKELFGESDELPAP